MATKRRRPWSAGGISTAGKLSGGVFEDLLMSNHGYAKVAPHNVGSHCWVYGGLSARTLEELADVWKTLSENDRKL